MPNTEEQRTDIIENCDILLNKFSGYEQTDSTPEGRLIAQLNWLKERAINHDLPLPLDKVSVSTLAYIYTDGSLTHHASSKDKLRQELEIPMQRILRLTKKAQLLLKKPYYIYATRHIDELISILHKAQRPLTVNEQSLIDELSQIKNQLIKDEIEPPLGSALPEFPNFNAVNRYKPTIEDLPNGKTALKAVAELIFNGVRPDNWLTPIDADRETTSLFA